MKKNREIRQWITGIVDTPAGEVPRVATKLDHADYWGAVKVRWLIGRDNYRIDPGLYAVGDPGANSDVFVSANYKLSFDHVRKNLDGIDAWILVLDTKGINVWCAAGKGTFGTRELVHRIKETGLEQIVGHRKIIVPQLGATGVSAYQVKTLTAGTLSGKEDKEAFVPVGPVRPEAASSSEMGFRVIFGPVRAADIKSFIRNGYKSTPEMRKVSFNFSDRARLLAVDIVYARYKLLAAFAVMFLLSAINPDGFSLGQAVDKGFTAVLFITLAYFTGITFTPLLLPYIPFRMFAFKGLISGLILSGLLLILGYLSDQYFEIFAWFLLLPAISSFMAMNFTGASTYTSLSGVKKEMRIFVPVQIAFTAMGLILYTVSNLLITKS